MSLSEIFFQRLGNINPITEIKARELWLNMPFNTKKKTEYNSDGHQGYTINRGNKRGRKVVILRYSYPLYGICGIMHDIVFGYYKAKKMDATIIINFEASGSYYNRKSWGKAENNLWERFFVQESDFNPNDEIVTLKCDGFWFNDTRFNRMLNLDKKNRGLQFISGDVGNKYRKTIREIALNNFHFRSDFLDKVIEEYRKVFGGIDACKVVGVLMREHFSMEYKKNVQDYAHKELLMRHPTVANADETIEIVREKIYKWQVDYIFVATLYDETIKKFQDEFGKNRILYINRKRLDSYNKNEAEFTAQENPITLDEIMNYNIKYSNLERLDTYMLELMLLSKCECFISATCSGGFFVPILKDKDFANIYYIGQ